MTAAELTYFPITGYFDTTQNGVLVNFNCTVVCTPRLPAGFTALIPNLDQGSGTGAPTALAFPPQVFTTVGGVLSGHLLANDPTVLGPALAAAGITQLWYDISFTQVSLGYQIQPNFSILAPTGATAVNLTDSTLTRYAYGGSVPTVSLPSGITPFGVSLVGAANQAAAQTLLGVSTDVDYLGQVTSQAAMVALSSAAVGNFCYRTDVSSFYYLINTPPSTAGNWVAPETVTPAGIGAVATGGALGTPTSGVLTNCTGSPTLTAPALGTPASGVLTNCTGLPPSTGLSTAIPKAFLPTGLSNFNTAQQSQACVTTTKYYVTGSNIVLPATLKTGMVAGVASPTAPVSGTTFIWDIDMSKDAASTGNTFAIIIFRGTNGTNADTADVTQTISGAGTTAVADMMTVEVQVTVTTTGASGAYYWSIIPTSKAATATGFGLVTGSSGYFSGTVSSVALNTASLIFGVGFVATSGTMPTITIPQVQAATYNLV